MNLKVRFRNKLFVASFVSQILLLAQLVTAFLSQNFGFDYTVSDDMIDGVMGIVNLVLVILAGLGIVVDPTTPGAEDSELVKRRK